MSEDQQLATSNQQLATLQARHVELLAALASLVEQIEQHVGDVEAREYINGEITTWWRMHELQCCHSRLAALLKDLAPDA